MKQHLLLFLSLALVACGPTHKLRKAQRLMDQAIAMGAKVKADTIEVEKTIPGKEIQVPVEVEKRVRYDSIIYQAGEPVKVPVFRMVRKDTTLLADGVEIGLKWRGKILDVSVKVPETKIKTPVAINKQIICPDCPRDRFWKGVGYGAAGLLILLIIYGLIRLIK